jgi:hypothetical protein
VIERFCVRRKGKGGKEVALPTIEALRGADPMPERVAEQVLVGVSTRRYGRSLEPVDKELNKQEPCESRLN